MADTGSTFANDVLKLLLNGTPIANIADNASVSPLTTLYVSLHTADPGTDGSQNTSEISYTGYSRAEIPRDDTGWTITGESVSPTSDITFGQMTDGTGGTATHIVVGTASSGTGKLLFRGTLSPHIIVDNGVVPELNTSSTITLS